MQLVTLEFSGGRLGQITIDRLCQGGTRYFEVRAECERGVLRASLGGRALAQIGIKRAERPGIRLDLGLGGLAWAEQGTRRRCSPVAPRADAWATTVLFRQIAAAFRADVSRRRAGGGPDTIAVIDAAYESAARGTRVELATRLRSAQKL